MSDTSNGFRGLPRLARVMIITVAVIAALVLLFGWIFPWVETNIYNPTLDGGLESSVGVLVSGQA